LLLLLLLLLLLRFLQALHLLTPLMKGGKYLANFDQSRVVLGCAILFHRHVFLMGS
jgi:hypothetical protein